MTDFRMTSQRVRAADDFSLLQSRGKEKQSENYTTTARRE
jgi:hypothetical protein